MPITLQIQGLNEFKTDLSRGADDVQKQVKWAMTQSVNAVMIKARDLAPYKTGTLRRSIQTKVEDGGFKGTVYQDSTIAPYGIIQEYGVNHSWDIYPVNAKALFWKGAAHPVKHVVHPPLAARPFMNPALEQSMEIIQQYFSKAMLNVILVMAGKA